MHDQAPSDSEVSIGTQLLKEENQGTVGLVLISRSQLRQKVPLSDRTILDMEKRQAFPKRFLIGHKVVWDLAEVDAWIRTQRATGARARVPGMRRERK